MPIQNLGRQTKSIMVPSEGAYGPGTQAGKERVSAWVPGPFSERVRGSPGTGQTQNILIRKQRNTNHFRDQKTENKFGSNFGNKGTQANF